MLLSIVLSGKKKGSRETHGVVSVTWYSDMSVSLFHMKNKIKSASDFASNCSQITVCEKWLLWNSGCLCGVIRHSSLHERSWAVCDPYFLMADWKDCMMSEFKTIWELLDSYLLTFQRRKMLLGASHQALLPLGSVRLKSVFAGAWVLVG